MSESEVSILSEIRERVVRVETKIDNQAGAKDTANEALQSSRSAHHRIDEMKSGQRWMIGTTLTVVALFFTAVGLLWKLVSGS